MIVWYSQTQIHNITNNLNNSNPPPDDNEPGIGIIYKV